MGLLHLCKTWNFAKVFSCKLSPTEVVSISVFSSCGSRGSVLVLELASVSSDTPAVDTDCTEPDLHTPQVTLGLTLQYIASSLT